MSENTPETAKLLAEIEKLELENKALRQPAWKTTTFYVTIIPLIVSIILNISQLKQSKLEVENNEKKFELERDKWLTEKDKIQLEFDDYKKRFERSDEEIETAKTELDQVVKNILADEEALAKSEVKLALSKAELSKETASGKNKKGGPYLTALSQNVQLDEEQITRLKEELSTFRARRTELESFIRK